MTRKRILCTAVLLCFLLLISGCGGGAAYDRNETAAARPSTAADSGGEMAGFAPRAVEYEMDDVADMAAEEPLYEAGNSAIVREMAENSRKIVYTVGLDLQTKEFDGDLAAMEALLGEFGGYVQSSSVEGKSLYAEDVARYARYTVRVPSARLDEFVERIGGIFNITSNTRNSDDITSSYTDVEARLVSLRIQEQALREMLESSGDLEYLLEVRRELAEVQYEIEYYTSMRAQMDSAVSMSTVNLFIYEVLEYQPVQQLSTPFGERVQLALQRSWQGFIGFCEGALFALIAILPFLCLLLAALVVLLVVLGIRRRRRRAASSKAAVQLHGLPGQDVEALKQPHQENPDADNES